MKLMQCSTNTGTDNLCAGNWLRTVSFWQQVRQEWLQDRLLLDGLWQDNPKLADKEVQGKWHLSATEPGDNSDIELEDVQAVERELTSLNALVPWQLPQALLEKAANLLHSNPGNKFISTYFPLAKVLNVFDCAMVDTEPDVVSPKHSSTSPAQDNTPVSLASGANAWPLGYSRLCHLNCVACKQVRMKQLHNLECQLGAADAIRMIPQANGKHSAAHLFGQRRPLPTAEIYDR